MSTLQWITLLIAIVGAMGTCLSILLGYLQLKDRRARVIVRLRNDDKHGLLLVVVTLDGGRPVRLDRCSFLVFDSDPLNLRPCFPGGEEPKLPAVIEPFGRATIAYPCFQIALALRQRGMSGYRVVRAVVTEESGKRYVSHEATVDIDAWSGVAAPSPIVVY